MESVLVLFYFIFLSFPKQRNIKYGLNLDWFSNMCSAESMLSERHLESCLPTFCCFSCFSVEHGTVISGNVWVAAFVVGF